MLNTLETSGYEAYEISNFAKPGFQSQHNGNYWKRKPYLGIGPSAHSFHGNNRSWNISNNALYIKGILENKRNFEEEILSPENHFNEYILTALRTQKGIGLSYIELNFKAIWKSNLLNKAKTHINQGNILVENSHLKLSSKGKLISDRIIQDLI
jgi:oxygen-independent coproporphyrinogen-3 oxidase